MKRNDVLFGEVYIGAPFSSAQAYLIYINPHLMCTSGALEHICCHDEPQKSQVIKQKIHLHTCKVTLLM